MKKHLLLLTLFFLNIANAAADTIREYPIRVLKAEMSVQNPVIDGVIHPGEWKGLENSGFVQTAGKAGEPAVYPTRFYFSRDNRFLFLAVECEDPEPEGIKANATKFDDDRIFYDDRIEIFLDVNHDHRTYYHFVVNPEGMMYDRKALYYLPGTRTQHGDVSWNTFWYATTRIHEKGWTAEMAIELSGLGIDEIEEGATWGFNLGRVRQPKENPGDEMRRFKPLPGTEYSAWKLVSDGITENPTKFFDPMEFGDLLFGDNGIEISKIAFPNLDYRMGPGGAWRPRGNVTFFGNNPFIIEFDQIDHQKLMVEVNVYKPATGGILTDASELIKTWSDKSVKEIEGNTLNLNYFVQNDQENLVEVILYDQAAGKQLYRTSYMVNVPPFIDFDFETLYTSQAGFNKPVGYKLKTGSIDADDYMLQLNFLDANHKSLDEEIIRNMPVSNEYQAIFNTELLRALEGDNYYVDCRLKSKSGDQPEGYFRQPLTKFSDHKPVFGVSRENYNFGGASGDAVIITFPFSARFVFWSKASYVAFWEVDQLAMTNQFVETWGMGIEGCAEPMQDKKLKYSTVSIVEDTPARIKVKWKYALADAHYYIHANEWVEELFTFYPDGTGVREINLFAHTTKDHQIVDIIYVNPPQVSSFQHFEDKVASVKNLSGESYEIREMTQASDKWRKFVKESKTLILETNLKNRLNPYSFFALHDTVAPFFEPTSYSIYNKNFEGEAKRGHWPNSRYPVDGYNTPGNDVMGHTGLFNINIMSDKDVKPNKWYMLTGITEEGTDADVLASRSWVYPVNPDKVSGAFTFDQYVFSQRAYVLNYKGKGKRIDLIFNGLLYKPAFVLKNSPFKAIDQLRINGKIMEKGSYAVGNNDRNEIILFIELHNEDETVLSIDLK